MRIADADQVKTFHPYIGPSYVFRHLWRGRSTRHTTVIMPKQGSKVVWCSGKCKRPKMDKEAARGYWLGGSGWSRLKFGAT